MCVLSVDGVNIITTQRCCNNWYSNHYIARIFRSFKIQGEAKNNRGLEIIVFMKFDLELVMVPYLSFDFYFRGMWKKNSISYTLTYCVVSRYTQLVYWYLNLVWLVIERSRIDSLPFHFRLSYGWKILWYLKPHGWLASVPGHWEGAFRRHLSPAPAFQIGPKFQSVFNYICMRPRGGNFVYPGGLVSGGCCPQTPAFFFKFSLIWVLYFLISQSQNSGFYGAAPSALNE